MQNNNYNYVVDVVVMVKYFAQVREGGLCASYIEGSDVFLLDHSLDPLLVVGSVFRRLRQVIGGLGCLRLQQSSFDCSTVRHLMPLCKLETACIIMMMMLETTC